MKKYKIIESAPYCCVCAVIESVLEHHGYSQNQFDIANYAGVTIPRSDLPIIPKTLTNIKFSDTPLDWGIHLYNNTLNDFFILNNIALKETFIPANQLADWNFESILDAIDNSYDIIFFFSYGILYKEDANKSVGHCALYIDKNNNNIIFQDPGPSNIGLNKKNIDNMFDAIKYGARAGSGISIINKI